MTAPARITQADATRLMKGARAAGYVHVRITLDPSGQIVVDARDEPPAVDIAPPNPLDRILPKT